MAKLKKVPSLVVGQPLDLLRKVIMEFGSTCSCVEPLAKRAEELARSRSWDTLYTEMTSAPQNPYGSATAFFVASQLSAFVTAYPFPPGVIKNVDPEGAALKKFFQAEHRCKWVNRKFRALKRHGNWLSDWRLVALERARHDISKLLGELPNLASIAERCDFTSGAAVGVHGNATNIARKLGAKRWTVTHQALPYAIPFLWRNDTMRDVILPGDVKCYDRELFEQCVMEKVELISHNKIGFAPKKVTVHRTVASEPTLNNYLQNGIDKELRYLLLNRWNVDLSDQRKNAELARLGSVGWDQPNPFVTLDLSSASDLISLEVVRYLLPPEWFELLNATRSPAFLLGGETTRYEKFCSMGNGFCFPLESMIFAAMAKVCGRITGDHEYSVYGDDIIVRKSCALILKELLGFVGFRVNEEKSFIFSPFRESCGSDWVAGRNVRPVNIDKPLSDIRHVFALHNSFYRHDLAENLSEGVRHILRKQMPDFLRPGREPGDTAFSVPLDVAMRSPQVRWSRQRQRWVWKEILSVPVVDENWGKGMSWWARRDIMTYGLLRGCTPEVMRRGDPLAPPLFTLRYSSTPKLKTVSRWWNDEFDPARAEFDRRPSKGFAALDREYRESASPSARHWAIWKTNYA